MAGLLHATLDACYKKLGWTGISMSCAFPAYGAKTRPLMPLMCRLVYRGSFFARGGEARGADVSSNELFAQSVVASDVFEVAQTIRTHLRDAPTPRFDRPKYASSAPNRQRS